MTMYGNIEAGRGINVAPVSGGVRVAADVAGLTGGSGITVADTGNGTYSITAAVASISAVVAKPLAAAASAGALGTAADAGHEHPRTVLGTSAATIGMDRNTTSDTAGQGLTISAGGATLASTNKAGGDLTLQSGTSTGTQASSILLKVPTAGGSGTTDRTPATVLTLAAATATFANTIVTRAGTTGAGTAPLTVTAGVLMTSPESGALEMDTNFLYFTDGALNRRGFVQAAVGATVNVSGAPNTNTGKFPIVYHGTTINVMTCD